jgi:hypothetical protein
MPGAKRHQICAPKREGQPASNAPSSNPEILTIGRKTVNKRRNLFGDQRVAGFIQVRPEIVWPAILPGWIVAIALSQGSSAKFIYFDF